MAEGRWRGKGLARKGEVSKGETGKWSGGKGRRMTQELAYKFMHSTAIKKETINVYMKGRRGTEELVIKFIHITS